MGHAHTQYIYGQQIKRKNIMLIFAICFSYFMCFFFIFRNLFICISVWLLIHRANIYRQVHIINLMVSLLLALIWRSFLKKNESSEMNVWHTAPNKNKMRVNKKKRKNWWKISGVAFLYHPNESVHILSH